MMLSNIRNFMVAMAVVTAVGTAQICEASPLSGAMVVRLPPAGVKTTAAYGVIQNSSISPVKIISATCADFAAVELHETTMTNGNMMMRPIAEVVVPAKGKVAFTSSGMHVMLIDAKRTLAISEKIKIEFTLADKSTLQITGIVSREIK